MTSVEVAAPHVTPADSSGKGSARLESGSGFDEADAGFSQHLANVVADGDGTAGTSAPQPANGSEVAVVRRWRQQARIDASQVASGQIQGGEQPGAVVSAFLADKAPDAPVAECAGDDAERQPGDAPETKPVDPAVRIAAVLATALAIMPAVVTTGAAMPQNVPETAPDPQVPARPESRLPAEDASVETTTLTVDVKVVGTETHLAPALRVLPATPPVSKPSFMERGGAADNRKSDQPVEGAKQSPRLRSQSPEQPVIQAASDQADADGSDAGSNSEGFTQVAQLTARGLMHANQAGGSPVQQIASRIAAELPWAGPDGMGAAPATTSRLAQLEPVKVLTIQLHPADLGTVTVRMTLKADAMDVQVETGRRATARLIDADRDALAGLLRSAGYHVEAVTVRAVEQPSIGIRARRPAKWAGRGNSVAARRESGGCAASGGQAAAGVARLCASAQSEQQ